MMKRLWLALFAVAATGPAYAATLKIATITPEGSRWMEQMRASAREIRERTDGRVEIKYYGGGVMGDDAKVLGKIRIGALQGGAFTPTALAARYPDINLYGLPLLFEDAGEAEYVRERLDEKLTDGLEEAGFISFGFATGGFAVLMSNSPVRSLADMKGKRVWVPEGDPISYASMEAMSLSPVTLPLTDVLTGLQTGLIDVVVMSPVGALVLQWHTKVDYINDLPLVYTIGFMAIDKRAFGKLSEADQAVVREVMTETYAEFDADNLAESREAYEALLNTGIDSVPFDAAEFEQIRQRLNQSNRELVEESDITVALFEELLGYVEDYRSDEGQTARR